VFFKNQMMKKGKGKLVLGFGLGLLAGYAFKREAGLLSPCPDTISNEYVPAVLISEPIKGQLNNIGSQTLSSKRKVW